MLLKNDIKEREKKEKEEVVDLLRKQMAVEVELVRLYEETAGDIQSRSVRNLLHMIELDSRKHIDICQTVINILQGEDVLKPEKKELKDMLRQHIALEKESIDRANMILKNVWIRETQGLKELIEKLKEDEKTHHEALKKLAEKAFFRQDFFRLDFFRDMEHLEERYVRSRELKKRRKQLELKK